MQWIQEDSILINILQEKYYLHPLGSNKPYVDEGKLKIDWVKHLFRHHTLTLGPERPFGV